MSELLKKAGQTLSEVTYSHINWSVHMVPTAKRAAEAFNEMLTEQQLPLVQLSVHSETSQDGVAADRIEFYYEPQPIEVPEVIPCHERLAGVQEEKARLVFTQSLSGGISAKVCLPYSEIAHPVKSSYVVAAWENPGLIGEGTIIDLLRLTVELNTYCGSINYPNQRGYKLLAKLETKDAILTQGRSRFWAWLNYFTRDSQGGARFYSTDDAVDATALAGASRRSSN